MEWIFTSSYGGDAMRGQVTNFEFFKFTAQDIITICKLKHYRMSGVQGILHYDQLRRLLKEKGLTDDQIKQCLHP